MDATGPEKTGAAHGDDASLRLSYGSAEELEKAYVESLHHAALFVAGDPGWQVGQDVRVCLQLAFCDREIEVDGRVAAVRPQGMTAAGAVPGVSLQLRTPIAQLRTQLEEAAGISLPEESSPVAVERRSAPRGPAQGMATLEVGSSHFPAQTLNISYGGMLALLHVDLDPGSEANVILHHPQTGDEMSVPCRIVSRALCDHGKMAVGVQFQYPASRIDEAMAFIDDLQSLQHAKELAQVAGSLEDAPLADVIETMAGASSEGTLRVERGDEEGILVHRDGELLHAATGLVTGMKAVSRLLLWRQGRFGYQASIEPFEATEAPMAIEAALLSAAVSVDEALRHGIDEFHPDDTFEVDGNLMDQIALELDEVHREIADHVRMGFPLGAILDILIQGDGVIYKALAELLDSGVISRASDAARA